MKTNNKINNVNNSNNANKAKKTFVGTKFRRCFSLDQTALVILVENNNKFQNQLAFLIS